jgi:hypothetical protein
MPMPATAACRLGWLPELVSDDVADGSSIDCRLGWLPELVSDDVADGSSIDCRLGWLPELVSDDVADGSSTIRTNELFFRVLHGRLLLWVAG